MEEEVTCHLINTGASSRSIFFVTAVMHQLLVATLRIRLTEATANCGTVCGRLKTWLKIINKHKSWQFTHLLIKQDCLAFSLDRIIAIY